MSDNWTKPNYPGEAVRIVLLRRDDDLGDVRIQIFGEGEAPARVGAFLPGRVICHPGDTPKTEPDDHQWTSIEAADHYFNIFVKAAIEDGWQEYRP